MLFHRELHREPHLISIQLPPSLLQQVVVGATPRLRLDFPSNARCLLLADVAALLLERRCVQLLVEGALHPELVPVHSKLVPVGAGILQGQQS
eukprot:1151892-Pelagomonas_calceolata.AAC.6